MIEQTAAVLGGTWEEMLGRSEELAGRRVQILVLGAPAKPPSRVKTNADNTTNHLSSGNGSWPQFTDSAAQEFVEQHPALKVWLPEALHHISRHFPGAPVGLSLTQPREPGEPIALRLGIETPLDAENAVAAHADLLSEWWIYQKPEHRELVELFLDFAPELVAA